MTMKISRMSKFVVGMTGLTLVLACVLEPPVQSEPPKDGPTAAPLAPVEAEATTSPLAQAEHNVIQTVPPAKPPPDLKISPALAELIKLVQAGVSEEVIFAFINNSTNAFQLSSAEILYLNDLGVSSNLMTAMLRTAGTQTNTALASVAQQPPPTDVVPSPPPVTITVTPPPTVPEVAVAEPALPATYVTTTTSYYPDAAATPVYETQAVNYYYDSLAPYGSWMNIAGYGWCWQPTVAVVDYSWRPYCHRGRWIYSNCGWYWLSDYSWGWAPFHYGRWHHHARAGWIWSPGTVWGPAWVSWRYSDGYCGWAPLPPEAHFAAGFGFSYYGSHVGIGFDFGLHSHHYTFIPSSRFCDYNPSRHLVSSTHVKNVYKDSTVVNNYIVGNNNTIVNEGIGANRIAAATRTNIRQVQIREHSPSNGRLAKPETLERDGSQLVVYRPRLPKQSARVPEILASRSTSTRHEDVRVASRTLTPSPTRTDAERSAQPVAAPSPERVRNNSEFTPGRSRGSSPVPRGAEAESVSRSTGRWGSSLPSRDETAGNRGTPFVTTPPVPPSASVPSTSQTQAEPPRRSGTFSVRRANGETFTIRPSTATQPNNPVTITGGTIPQPQARGNSPPNFRSSPEQSMRPTRVTPTPEASRFAPESRPPAVTRPQGASVESASNPRSIPNYSRPQSVPAPSYQPPPRERPSAVSPSIQPQYRAPQSSAPQYVAPQAPRVETRAPERSSPPPAAQSAPSRSSRSESLPSSSSRDRPDRNRN